MLKFNINNYIRVKLKEEGYKYWKTVYDSVYQDIPHLHQYIKPLEAYKAKADKDGYIKMQAWEFMRIFGDTISLGTICVFDTEILIEERYLQAVEQTLE